MPVYYMAWGESGVKNGRLILLKDLALLLEVFFFEKSVLLQ